jgi:hypothetical protein
VSLRIVAGRLDVSSNSIVCQLLDGATRVGCTIARQVLRDLGDFHQLRGSEEAVFRQLLPEIERLASTKFHAGRTDESGMLSIGIADLLRYSRSLSTPVRVAIERPQREGGRLPGAPGTVPRE